MRFGNDMSKNFVYSLPLCSSFTIFAKGGTNHAEDIFDDNCCFAGALTAFAQDDKDNHNTVEKCDTLTSTSVEKGNVYMSHYRPATSDSAQYKPKNYYIDSHAVTMPNHNAFSYKIKQDDRPVELLDWLGGLLKDILF